MTQGQEPRIKAWLKGDLCDLQRLAVLLAEGDVRVIHDPDRDAYYLTASEIDRPPDGVAYYDVAREHVAYINGIARTTNMGYRPVKLTGGFSEGDSEHQVIFVESVLELRISMGIPAVTVTTQDGTVVPQPPSPVPARLALANSHADVAQVLKIMGSETLDWSKLFKVREIINDSVKAVQGEIKYQPIVGMGWTDKRTDSSFTGSANHEKVSGDEARHARSSSEPPANPMTISQGQDYIRNIVTRWLDWLRSL